MRQIVLKTKRPEQDQGSADDGLPRPDPGQISADNRTKPAFQPSASALRKGIQLALNNLQPGISADLVFDRIEQKHAARMKATGRGH